MALRSVTAGLSKGAAGRHGGLAGWGTQARPAKGTVHRVLGDSRAAVWGVGRKCQMFPMTELVGFSPALRALNLGVGKKP